MTRKLRSKTTGCIFSYHEGMFATGAYELIDDAAEASPEVNPPPKPRRRRAKKVESANGADHS